MLGIQMIILDEGIQLLKAAFATSYSRRKGEKVPREHPVLRRTPIAGSQLVDR